MPRPSILPKKRNGDFCSRSLIEQGRLDTVHDLSDGGLLVAVAEMALSGGIGTKLKLPAGAKPIPFLFGEDQARYLLAVRPNDAARSSPKRAAQAFLWLPWEHGRPQNIAIEDAGDVTLAKLRAAHESWLPAYMSG